MWCPRRFNFSQNVSTNLENASDHASSQESSISKKGEVVVDVCVSRTAWGITKNIATLTDSLPCSVVAFALPTSQNKS